MSTPMALPPSGEQRIGMLDRAIALATFSAAVVLLRLPFGRTVAAIRALHATVAHPATVAQVETALACARAAARWWPGRAACLEHSLAAVLYVAAHRRRVDWCIGARLLPYASHAWIELDNHPVGESPHPDRPYLILLRV